MGTEVLAREVKVGDWVLESNEDEFYKVVAIKATDKLITFTVHDEAADQDYDIERHPDQGVIAF